jgi:hypothetical protein
MPPLSENFLQPYFQNSNTYQFSTISFLITLFIFSIFCAFSVNNNFVYRCKKKNKSKKDFTIISISIITYIWIFIEITTATIWIEKGYNNELYIFPILLTFTTPITSIYLYDILKKIIKSEDKFNNKSINEIEKINSNIEKNTTEIKKKIESILYKNNEIYELISKKNIANVKANIKNENIDIKKNITPNENNLKNNKMKTNINENTDMDFDYE